MDMCVEAQFFNIIWALKADDPKSFCKMKSVRMDGEDVEIEDNYITAMLDFLNFKEDCVIETP